jgi:hypothetical protein
MTTKMTSQGIKIRPHGVVLTINYEGRTYIGFLENDFERFKTFGNHDLSVDTLILFDEEWNHLSFSERNTKKTCELYDIIEDLIEKIVINENHEDEEEE